MKKKDKEKLIKKLTKQFNKADTPEKSLKIAKQILSLEKTNLSFRIMGIAYSLMGRSKYAIRYFKKAIANNDSEVFDLLFLAYIDSGQIDQAKEFYHQNKTKIQGNAIEYSSWKTGFAQTMFDNEMISEVTDFLESFLVHIEEYLKNNPDTECEQYLSQFELLALCYWKQQKFNETLDTLEKIESVLKLNRYSYCPGTLHSDLQSLSLICIKKEFFPYAHRIFKLLGLYKDFSAHMNMNRIMNIKWGVQIGFPLLHIDECFLLIFKQIENGIINNDMQYVAKYINIAVHFKGFQVEEFFAKINQALNKNFNSIIELFPIHNFNSFDDYLLSLANYNTLSEDEQLTALWLYLYRSKNKRQDIFTFAEKHSDHKAIFSLLSSPEKYFEKIPAYKTIKYEIMNAESNSPVSKQLKQSDQTYFLALFELLCKLQLSHPENKNIAKAYIKTAYHLKLYSKVVSISEKFDLINGVNDDEETFLILVETYYIQKHKLNLMDDLIKDYYEKINNSLESIVDQLANIEASLPPDWICQKENDTLELEYIELLHDRYPLVETGGIYRSKLNYVLNLLQEKNRLNLIESLDKNVIVMYKYYADDVTFPPDPHTITTQHLYELFKNKDYARLYEKLRSEPINDSEKLFFGYYTFFEEQDLILEPQDKVKDIKDPKRIEKVVKMLQFIVDKKSNETIPEVFQHARYASLPFILFLLQIYLDLNKFKFYSEKSKEYNLLCDTLEHIDSEDKDTKTIDLLFTAPSLYGAQKDDNPSHSFGHNVFKNTYPDYTGDIYEILKRDEIELFKNRSKLCILEHLIEKIREEAQESDEKQEIYQKALELYVRFNKILQMQHNQIMEKREQEKIREHAEFIEQREKEVMKAKLAERDQILSDVSHSIKNLLPSSIVSPLVRLQKQVDPKNTATIERALRGANLIGRLVESINNASSGCFEDFVYDANNESEDSLSLHEIIYNAIFFSIGNIFYARNSSKLRSKYFLEDRELESTVKEALGNLEPNNFEQLSDFCNQYLFDCEFKLKGLDKYILSDSKGSAMKILILFQEIIFNAVKYSRLVKRNKRFLNVSITPSYDQFFVEIKNSASSKFVYKETGLGTVIVEKMTGLMNAKYKRIKSDDSYCVNIKIPNFWKQKQSKKKQITYEQDYDIKYSQVSEKPGDYKV